MILPHSRLLTVLALSSLLFSCAQPASQNSQTLRVGKNAISDEAMTAAKKRVSFDAHVKPILETKCVMCHNSRTLPGRLSLENRAAAMKPGALGAFIVPGHPKDSRLIRNINSAHAHVNSMPPVGERITKQEMKLLSKWIKDGAEWPAGKAGELNPEWQPQS